MNTITTTEFRSHMSDYLDDIKKWDVLFLWRRNKKEFIILPIELLDVEDIESLKSAHLAKKIAQARSEEKVSIHDIEQFL